MKSKDKLKLKVVCGLSGLLLLQGHAYADTTPTPEQQQIIRTSTEAGRINQAMTQSSLASVAPPEQTTVKEQRSVGTLSPEAAKVSLQLRQINIEGAEVFSTAELIAPYKKYIGKVITLGDVEDIAQEMTTRYQKAGYILTRVIIPPQHIKDGVITLKVVEGYVDKVYVQGNVRPSVAALLEKYGDNIRAAKPLQIKVLERYALLANDLPGVSARVVLAPSTTQVGAADLTFVTSQQTVNAYVSFDNRGTKFLGPKQTTIGANINSIFRPGDTTGVQYLRTIDNELNFLQVSHSEPLGSSGLTLDLNAGYTEARPSSSLSDLDIVGKSTTANAQLSYPIIRSRSQNLYAHAGLGTLDSHTTILSQDLYFDHIRFFDTGFNYSKADHWLGVNEIAADLTQGLDVMGASDFENTSRIDAGPKFTKYNINISRLQGLPANFSVLVAGQGQYTDDSLYAAEQFGFGGASFGRGYDPSEITGDRGAAGKIELRYDIRQNQLYAFYDIGKVWNINTLAQPAEQSGASTGIGARLHLTSWLAGNLEIDKPLTRKVAASDNRDMRVYFGITVADSHDYHGNYSTVNQDANKTQPDFNAAPAPVVPPVDAAVKAKN